MGESPFAIRGVVEGYYGRPYTHQDRLWLIERMAEWDLDTYVYAPKDDALHRDRWREPYSPAQLDEFRRLVEHGTAHGVRVGFAIAPGLSIEYGSASDRKALEAKLDAFTALGSRFFCLALDDVPSELQSDADRKHFDSLAAAHVDLANSVKDRLPDDATLWLVPTDYAGTEASPYLEQLGDGLDPSVEVGWTGRSVVSPTIAADEAGERSRALGRRLLLWDNYPVNDGPMRNVLHLGPYQGRDAGLPKHLSGILLNPMEHVRASAIGLATAARYMVDPDHYEANGAWEAEARRCGAGAESAFVCFASAHRFSALAPNEREREIEPALRTLRSRLVERDRTDGHDALAKLRARLDAAVGAADSIRRDVADRALAQELEPWLVSHERETRRLIEATDLLAVLVENAAAMPLALAFFRMEGRLTGLPPAQHVSYGPRRHIYPQLESLEEHRAHFSGDPVLFVDHCLVDEAIRLAETLALERLGGRRFKPPSG